LFGHFSAVSNFELRLEDCVAGMARLAASTVDLVVTSPPYNLGIRYGKYSDRQDRQAYLKWCASWAEQVRRLLKPGGSFFLNIGAAPSNPMLPHEIVFELRGFFILQNTIHWVKSIAIEERTFGHFKPISSKRFAMNTFFTSPNQVASKSIAWRLASRIRTKATYPVGRIPAEAIFDVAGTLGLFPTKQSRVAKENARIPRRFQFSSPSGV
jgi:DNA modification methylase